MLFKITEFFHFQDTSQKQLTSTTQFYLSYLFPKSLFPIQIPPNNHNINQTRYQPMIPVQISIVTVDPSTIQLYQKSVLHSFNFSEWLKLLNMYKHNQMWKRVDQCIININSRFLVKELFWVKELDQHWNRIDYDKPEEIQSFWEMMKLGFENDYKMKELGEKLANWVVHVYKNIGKFTLNQAEIKLEWLIDRFKWDMDDGAIYFEKMRELYSPGQVNKIRKAYHKEFSLPFKSNDVIMDEYQTWETDPGQLKKAQELYNKMIVAVDQIIDNIDSMRFEQLPIPIALNLKHEDTQYNDSDYLDIIVREPSNAKRVLLLKKEAKQGRLQIQYLEELEKSGIYNQQQLNREYAIYLERTINHGTGPKIELIIRRYLTCLVRRVNKHLLSTQPQQYLDTWGDKVTFMRQQFKRLMTKVYKGVQFKLYKFWAEIETFVVKDINTVCYIYEELVKNKIGRTDLYLEYAHTLVILGNVPGAVETLQKGIQKCEDNESIKQKLRTMKDLFGTVEQLSLKYEQEKQQVQKHPSRFTPQHSQQVSKQHGQKKMHDRILDIGQKRNHKNQTHDEITTKMVTQEKQRYHSDSGKTIFIKGVPDNWDESDVLNLFDDKEEVADVRIVESHKKRKMNDDSTRFTNVCYVDMVSQEAAEKAIKNNRRKDITMELSRPPRQSHADERTILFAGLSTQATEKDIGQFLSEYEGVEDIRLLSNQEGSRGIAFVQFKTEQKYDQAWHSLIKRKLVIKDKGFVMRECDNQRSNTKNMSTVVFLEGLAYKASQTDIQKFFKDKGIQNIKQIQIPRNDQQKSKGFAYVQFSVFKDYQKALDLSHGAVLGREFKIKKSDRKITKKVEKVEKQKSNSDFLKLFK